MRQLSRNFVCYSALGHEKDFKSFCGSPWATALRYPTMLSCSLFCFVPQILVMPKTSSRCKMHKNILHFRSRTAFIMQLCGARRKTYRFELKIVFLRWTSILSGISFRFMPQASSWEEHFSIKSRVDSTWGNTFHQRLLSLFFWV